MNLEHAEKVLHNCLFIVAVLETKRRFSGRFKSLAKPANEG